MLIETTNNFHAMSPMFYRKIACIIVLLMTLSFGAWGQQTLVLPCAGDTWIDQRAENRNNNNDKDTKVDVMCLTFSSVQASSRGYLNFDLSAIPAGATLTAANLSLYFWPESPSSHYPRGDNKFTLRRVLTKWDEKTLTWTNAAGLGVSSQNTYTHSATTLSSHDYTNMDVTELVKDMIADPDNSFGFDIRLLTETPQKQLHFCSKNYADTSLHPKLTVTYVAPPTTIHTLAIEPATYCPGDTVFVAYTVDKDYAGDNIFTAVLSDANGSFDAPTPIGSLAGVGSGTMLGVLPLGLAAGSKYRVRVVSSNPQEVGAAGPTQLTVKAGPPKPTVTRNGNLLVSSAATGNQWHNEAGPVSGATDRSFLPTRNGAYFVVVTRDGCTAVSDTLTFSGRSAAAEAFNLTVSPNPSDGRFTAPAPWPLRLTAYNSMGQQVAETEAGGEVDWRHLPAGVYLLKGEGPGHEAFISRLMIAPR